jgi:DNA-binding response OmpR family regulator
LRILIAEDDLVSRRLLETTLVKRGYQVEIACNGREAMEALQRDDPAPLAILDWDMPEFSGVEICRYVREHNKKSPTYLLLLTTKTGKENIITGLQAGADDYITKPFDREELLARVRVGERVVELQQRLSEQVKELEYLLSFDPFLKRNDPTAVA